MRRRCSGPWQPFPGRIPAEAHGCHLARRRSPASRHPAAVRRSYTIPAQTQLRAPAPPAHSVGGDAGPARPSAPGRRAASSRPGPSTSRAASGSSRRRRRCWAAGSGRPTRTARSATGSPTGRPGAPRGLRSGALALGDQLVQRALGGRRGRLRVPASALRARRAGADRAWPGAAASPSRMRGQRRRGGAAIACGVLAPRRRQPAEHARQVPGAHARVANAGDDLGVAVAACGGRRRSARSGRRSCRLPARARRCRAGRPCSRRRAVPRAARGRRRGVSAAARAAAAR